MQPPPCSLCPKLLPSHLSQGLESPAELVGGPLVSMCIYNEFKCIYVKRSFLNICAFSLLPRLSAALACRDGGEGAGGGGVRWSGEAAGPPSAASSHPQRLAFWMTGARLGETPAPRDCLSTAWSWHRDSRPAASEPAVPGPRRLGADTAASCPPRREPPGPVAQGPVAQNPVFRTEGSALVSFQVFLGVFVG